MLSIRLRNDGDLGLIYPPTREGGMGHEVHIPLTLAGLSVLKRALMVHDSTKKIGTPEVPTSTMVEAWIQEERRARAELTILNVEIKL